VRSWPPRTLRDVIEDGYVRVATSAEVGGPPFLRVEAAGTTLLLARLSDGTVRAFGAACPHLRQPLTHGIVTGTTLECPFHFYAYDLDTGRNTFPGDEDAWPSRSTRRSSGMARCSCGSAATDGPPAGTPPRAARMRRPPSAR
jgi:nitrite reductase (NADH) small subunit